MKKFCGNLTMLLSERQRLPAERPSKGMFVTNTLSGFRLFCGKMRAFMEDELEDDLLRDDEDYEPPDDLSDEEMLEWLEDNPQ